MQIIEKKISVIPLSLKVWWPPQGKFSPVPFLQKELQNISATENNWLTKKNKYEYLLYCNIFKSLLPGPTILLSMAFPKAQWQINFPSFSSFVSFNLFELVFEIKAKVVLG